MTDDGVVVGSGGVVATWRGSRVVGVVVGGGGSDGRHVIVGGGWSTAKPTNFEYLDVWLRINYLKIHKYSSV